MTNDLLLDIKELHVKFNTPDGDVLAVNGVDMQIRRGETVAVVGESGSGKSQTMMSIMGLLANNGYAQGQALFDGVDLLALTPPQLDKFRGSRISMIFQEPMTSLDPLYPISRQMMEPLQVHGKLSKKAARARVLELLELVHLPNAAARMNAYPHELSGGQRQRVMIAMALANNPELLIADEPTTALDVTIQAEILALLAELQSKFHMAIIFVTHDLTIVESFSNWVYVMRSGHIVESGVTKEIFNNPREEYTKMLLTARPEGIKSDLLKDGPEILSCENVDVVFRGGGGFLARKVPEVHAVKSASLRVRRGQTIGIVGESGSGKSTLGRAILQLLPNSEGAVIFRGQDISTLGKRQKRPIRADLQIVFQDPYGSLSPRMSVGEIISEGLLVHEPKSSSKERDARAVEVLKEVGLDPAVRHRFPHEFSGGQRQRIAIARALILKPELIVLDEPTSALDRSVQKQVITLLRRLQIEHNLTYLFISHDLSVIQAISDEVIVMKSGEILEHGPTAQIFENPQNDYTKELIRAAFNLSDILDAKRALV